MILADSDSEFKQFQDSVNISIYQVLELELLRVRKWEVRNWEVTMKLMLLECHEIHAQ